MLEYLIVSLLSFYIGWWLREKYAEHKMMLFVDKMEHNIRQELADQSIQIIIEVHQGDLFVYNKKDHSFMAQGKTREELEENLRSKYPGKRFGATEENLKEVGFTR